jgi:anaerobic C4-dicarboxylate transporter
VGLRLGGIALGLLSGLGLGLLTFSGRMQPTFPPYDLIILHASWMVLVATLEGVGFFALLGEKLKLLVVKPKHYPVLPIVFQTIFFYYLLFLYTGTTRLWTLAMCSGLALLIYKVRSYVGARASSQRRAHACCVVELCYCLSFLTGDGEWLHKIINDKNNITQGQKTLTQYAAGIAIHMGLLTSPLFISGLLLLWVVGNSSLSVFVLVRTIGCLTVGITVLTRIILLEVMPRQWLTKKLNKWFGHGYDEDEVPVITESQYKKKVSVFFLGVILRLVAGLFVLAKHKTSIVTELRYVGKIFQVRFPMFFALMLLSVAAITLLSCKVQPVKVLQTNRFKLGIQQFFNFLGVVWFAEALISYDQAFLISILHDSLLSNHYLFYLILMVYLSLVDISMVIWLFIPLLIEAHFSNLGIALLLVGVHSLAPIRFWVRVGVGKKNGMLTYTDPLPIKE